MQLPTRADYTCTIEDDVIIIIDLDKGNATVTNDIEMVIQDLVQDGVPVDSMPIIYQDSMGVWDQVIIKNSRFHSFKSLKKARNSKDAAKWLAKGRTPD
jgi:hypothetical protein